jgi:CRISPR-associated protein Csm3
VQLTDIKEIKGQIILRSGLHIGAGDAEMQIGGTDNPVIKHPHTLEPFIPGSSLKGKVRSLLELRSGLVGKEGEPLQAGLLESLNGQEEEECLKILKIFGSSGAEADETGKIGPTRVSFSDCPLTDEWREKAQQERLSLTEVKSENSIDRIRGTALNPRFTERVPAGTTFDFSVYLKILNTDEEPLMDYLLMGMKLLQMDSLGGSGSRGYGKIEFEFSDPAIRRKFDEIDPFAQEAKHRETL